MNDVPKIVQHRLRAAVPEESHPEADLLTAFAEQSLSPAERETVLQHLALCTDCREVVALALPAEDAVSLPAQPEVEVAPFAATPARTSPKRFVWANLGWAQLRWATLAAGIAVAVLVMRPGLQQNQQQANPAASKSPAPAVAPAPGSPAASDRVAENLPQQTLRGQTTPGQTRADSKTAASGSTMDPASNAPRAKLQAPQRDVQNQLASDLKKENTPAANKAFRYPPVSPPDATAANPADNLMARADAPAIEKAKPALKDSQTANESQKESAGPQSAAVSSSQPTSASPANGQLVGMRAAAPAAIASRPAPNWMIVNGVLQRSFDSGRSWQTAVQAEHALLCYATLGSDVWAGGKAGTLMHSVDGGITWSALAVSSQSHPLTADVSRIDVRSAANIVLTTDNHETWSSADTGKTWEKQ